MGVSVSTVTASSARRSSSDCMSSMETWSDTGPAAGFAPKELQTGNGVWRVDMMKCPYHDTCTEYGCPELCRCFCDSDDISYTGLHPKLIWERSMTLGRGNDRCDFCMKTIK